MQQQRIANIDLLRYVDQCTILCASTYLSYIHEYLMVPSTSGVPGEKKNTSSLIKRAIFLPNSCGTTFVGNPSSTHPFTVLEPQNQEIGEFYVDQESRSTDFEAPKLRKGRLGTA